MQNVVNLTLITSHSNLTSHIISLETYQLAYLSDNYDFYANFNVTLRLGNLDKAGCLWPRKDFSLPSLPRVLKSTSAFSSTFYL